MLSLINVTFLLVSFTWFKADDLILLGHVHPAYSPSFIRSLGSSPLLPFVFFVPLSHVHTFHKCSYTSIHTLKKHTNTHTHSVSTQPPWIRSHSHRLPGTLTEFSCLWKLRRDSFCPFLYCPPIKTLQAYNVVLHRTKPNPHYPFEMSPNVGC